MTRTNYGRAPDLQGVGSAWRVRMLEQGKRGFPDRDACVSMWLLRGPWHPFWDHWALSAVSLADFPGVRPAVKHYPEAEWEISILSLDPDKSVDLFAWERGIGKFHWLEPADFVHQFDGVRREDVERILEGVVRLIVEGKASPDQDWRSYWRLCVENGVRHAKGEAHLPQGGGR